MAGQLRGLLFDFDDTLVDWSGVRLGWREIEAARLTRVCEYVQRKTRDSRLNTSSLLEIYLQRTRAAWAEARLSLRAPHMPSILMGALEERDVAIDRLDAEEVIQAYGWNVVPGAVVFPDVPPALKMLREQGIKLGIVTNASQPMSMRDAELATHGLLEFFPDCRSGGGRYRLSEAARADLQLRFGANGHSARRNRFHRRQSGGGYRRRQRHWHARDPAAEWRLGSRRRRTAARGAARPRRRPAG